jgi:hypothetical protein
MGPSASSATHATGSATGARSPTGPSGPGTGTPARDQPGPTSSSGPTTGGGAPAARRGTPLTLTHGLTAQRLLEIAWDNAVFAPPEPAAGTQAATLPLPAEAAFAYIAGSDKRPLLVMRECPACRGTDLALLRTDVANERTLLLTRFFHCVRLPTNVAAPEHAFARLFTGHVHLFLCDGDGGNRVDFSGTQSQSEVIQAMRKAIERNRDIDATGALNELQKALAQLDRVDAQEADTRLAIDKELDQRSDRTRVVELQKRGNALVAERKAILARIAELGSSSR